MIKELQDLAPRRRLSRDEALAVAEIQAARLRQKIGAKEAAITDEQLRSISEVRLESVPDLGVSGATRRIGDLWVILVNADEPAVRHRFTIAHELKHILDDEATAHLRRLGREEPRQWLTERICDYFAACLLMPRLWVKRIWADGTQNPIELARRFAVSTDAMRIRLQQLGLVEPYQRCATPTADLVALPTRVAA